MLKIEWFGPILKDGNYSVKSGNWLLNKESEMENPVPESCCAVNFTKEKVWKINTAPKIKIFLWRCLSGALAVEECLICHGIHANPLCQVCSTEDETISHVLYRCLLVVQVWTCCGLPLPSNGFSDSILDNINFC